MVIDGGGFISRISRLFKPQEPSTKRKAGEVEHKKERDKIVRRVAERISIEMLRQMGVIGEEKGKGGKIDLLG